MGLLPSPETLAALVKIGLLVGGLMTAAAYLVLVERWMAAWVQDRQGPNRSVSSASASRSPTG
jgi:NADH:ubiquinone oxidoreductase subunit H